jgi:hypothetical protein
MASKNVPGTFFYFFDSVVIFFFLSRWCARAQKNPAYLPGETVIAKIPFIV